MSFPFGWKNRGEPEPTRLNRQNLNSAEEGLVTSIGLVSPLPFGLKADRRRVVDAAIEAGQKTLTETSLTAADAGKVVLIGGAGGAGGGFLTTLVSASAGTAQTAVAASTTVSGATALIVSDSTAAMKALVATFEAGRGYVIVFPPGGAAFNEVEIGEEASQRGITIKLRGAGDRSTFLYPISATGAKTALTVVGPGDSTSASFKTEDLTIGFDFNDPVLDFSYTQPFVHLKGIVGYDMLHISRFLGTGTALKLDGSYAGSYRDTHLQTGRYGVGVEIDDIVGSPPQEDTFGFKELKHEGCYGVVVRNIASGLDSSVFDQFKSAVYTPGITDRSVFAEGFLSAEAKEGATTITLESGQAKSMGYEPATLPCPVAIGYGTTFEPNKVLSVSGDTLTLSQPLRFNHAEKMVVMHGTVAISLPSNVQAISTKGCHLEGHSGAGILCDSGTLIAAEKGLSACRALVRICGGAANVRVSQYLMQGSTWIGGALSNIPVEVPAFNTNASLTRIIVDELERGFGAEAITYLYDPGNNARKGYTRIVDVPSGVPRTSIGVPVNDAISTSTLVHEQLSEEGETIWQRLLNGSAIYRKDTRTKRRGAGSFLVETLNAGTPEEEKGVAIGNSEVRWGEDTAVTRVSKNKLSSNAQITAKAGVITVTLEGAGLVTVTDALIETAVSVKPGDGMHCIHLDTTTGRKYLSFRSNGAWLLLVNDYDSRGQAGILTPQATGWRFSTLTAVTGNAYVMRFKTTLPFTIKKGVIRMTTKAGSNDTVEVGIYSAAWAKLATSGPVSGLLNGATGFLPIPIEFTLVPGIVYYAALAFGTVGSTGAIITGAEYASGENAKFFGEGAGISEYDSHASDAPLPETFVGGGSPIAVPVLALRQS